MITTRLLPHKPQLIFSKILVHFTVISWCGRFSMRRGNTVYFLLKAGKFPWCLATKTELIRASQIWKLQRTHLGLRHVLNAHCGPPRPWGTCGVYWRPVAGKTHWTILPRAHLQPLCLLRSGPAQQKVQVSSEPRGFLVPLTAWPRTARLNTVRQLHRLSEEAVWVSDTQRMRRPRYRVL